MTKHSTGLPYIDFRGLDEGRWFCIACAQAAGEGKTGWLSVPRSNRPMTRCPDCRSTSTALFEGGDYCSPIQSFVCRRCAVVSAARVRIGRRRLRCCYDCGSIDLLTIRANRRQATLFRSRYRSATIAYEKEFLRAAAAFPDFEAVNEVALAERYSGLADFNRHNPSRNRLFDFILHQLSHGTAGARLLAGYVKYHLTRRQLKSMAGALDSILDGPERGARWRQRLMLFIAPKLLKEARYTAADGPTLVEPVLTRVLKGNRPFISGLRLAKRADRPTLRCLKHYSKKLEGDLSRAIRERR